MSRNPWAEMRRAIPPDVDAAIDAAVGLPTTVKEWKKEYLPGLAREEEMREAIESDTVHEVIAKRVEEKMDQRPSTSPQTREEEN